MEKENLNSMNISMKTRQSQTSTNINEENLQDEDCFEKFGFISSLEKRRSEIEFNENEIDQDQPTKLTEHINAVIALIFYHTYSKNKHQSKSSHQNHHIQFIRDDIDRFDILYYCLIHQTKYSKKMISLNHILSKRFFKLRNIKKLQEFEQNEYSRLSKEKKMYLNRVPFIPNLSSYQRRCPYYRLEELKWIRDHLC